MDSDPIGARLAALSDTLADELGDRIAVSVEELEFGRSVELVPAATTALPISWLDEGQSFTSEPATTADDGR